MSDRFTVRYNPIVDNGNPQNGTSSVDAIDAGSMQILDATSRMVVEIQVRDIDQAQGNDAAAQIQAHLNDHWGYSVADSVYMMASGQQPTVERVYAGDVADDAAHIIRGAVPQAIIGDVFEIDSSIPSNYRTLGGASSAAAIADDGSLSSWSTTYRIWSNQASPTGQAEIELVDPYNRVHLHIPISQLSQEEATLVAGAIQTGVLLGRDFETAVHAQIASESFASQSLERSPNALRSAEEMQQAAQRLIDGANRDSVKGVVGQPTIGTFIP